MAAISVSYLFSHVRQSVGSLSTTTSALYDKIQQIVTAGPEHRDHILYPRFKTSQDGHITLSQATAAFFTMKAAQSSMQHTSASREDVEPILSNGLDMPVTPGYIAPRAPIVLCHGLYGYDKIGPDAIPSLQIHYWGGIDDALAKLGAKVIVTRVPRTGGIQQRAQQLHTILKATAKGKDINFLAHSMGGLDCRYLISHIKDRPYKVKSLTTVATPHRGSPFMDWCRDHLGVGVLSAMSEAAYEAKQLEVGGVDPGTASIEMEQGKANKQTVYEKKKDSGFSIPFVNNISLSALAKIPTTLIDPVVSRVIQSLDTPAYSNLTTDYCKNHFNPNTPDDPTVDYYSYGASKRIPIWSTLGFPWQVIQEKEGDNDGLVSLTSAKWGRYVETVNADHWELKTSSNLHPRKLIPGTVVEKDSKDFDPVEFYMRMATYLYHQGH
ncbi:hypothetical protein INT43_006246 [Umbelopsis isabellina]|uniref:AB hydrolase-1 domain-containing protein n=1 Tax=Mortierella isabellina TaxID=91625 RepID=A0A8H7PZP0_MORIS|nr:hypothetical protein INT43_006246 [Umbelopsis isabellina]